MPKSLYSQAGALLLALGFIAGVIALMGVSPLQVVSNMGAGAFSTFDRFARVLATLVPILLCSCGLIFTFTTGLYNLGIEGQMVMGAITTTFVLRLFQNVLPAPSVILLGLLAGILGGFLWGLFAAALNIYGRVNEIFAGLGLNFVADGLGIYLIFGPWQRPGVASMSGTELFDESLWLPVINRSEASPVALAIAVAGTILTIVVIRGTHFGLRLRAVGQNLRASYVLGIPSVFYLLSSFGLCGAFAGLAGGLQVLAVFHRLIPNISSNLGFLSLLVVMLVNYDALFILPVSFFFSILSVGALQLPLVLNLESSLSGVIQGTLVLFVLLGRGFAPKQPQTGGTST